VLEEQKELSPGLVKKEEGGGFTFGNVFAQDFKPVENLPLEHFGIN